MKNKKVLIGGIVFLVFVIFCALGYYFLVIEKNETKKNGNLVVHPALYQACDEDSCIYILGTMHMGDSKLAGLTDEIWNAYNDSDAIAFELDVTTVPIEASTELVMLEDGDDLSNYMTQEEFDKLESFLAKRMIPIDVVRSFNLAGIASLLEELAYMELQLQADNGVDMQLLNKAHEDNKEIIELETYEFQFELLYGFKDEYYIDQINSIIDNYSYTKENIQLLYNSYASGNIWLLKQLLSGEDSDSSSEYNQKILIDRNINMAEKADTFLKENKKVTIAVGAAHVVGESGIVDLLKEKGYKVSLVK